MNAKRRASRAAHPVIETRTMVVRDGRLNGTDIELGSMPRIIVHVRTGTEPARKLWQRAQRKLGLDAVVVHDVANQPQQGWVTVYDVAGTNEALHRLVTGRFWSQCVERAELCIGGTRIPHG